MVGDGQRRQADLLESLLHGPNSPLPVLVVVLNFLVVELGVVPVDVYQQIHLVLGDWISAAHLPGVQRSCWLGFTTVSVIPWRFSGRSLRGPLPGWSLALAS